MQLKRVLNGYSGYSGTDRSKAVLLLWIIYVFFCLVFVMPLCACVYLCLVVTYWERADLLALICGVLL